MRAPSTISAAAAEGVDGVLGHEGPAGLAGAVLEEVLEGGADSCFVGDAEVGEPVEGGVVGLDGSVVGLRDRVGIFNCVRVKYGRVDHQYNTTIVLL